MSFEVKGNFTSHVIGMREHNPSFYLQNAIRASTILGLWVVSMLHEFNVKVHLTPIFYSEVADAALNEFIPSGMDEDANENDVLLSNGDGGPDALRMNVKLVDAHTEWCGGHWLNRLMIDGFGCSIDPAKSKNVEARKIIEAVKKTVEKINKSDKLMQLFGEQLVNDCMNQNIRLQNTPHHRWSNLEELLFKMLCLWQQVIQTFAVSGSVAPIHGMMPVLKEFWTVLSNVKIC